MQSREGRQQMISSSERDNFKGTGPKRGGESSMKILILTKGMVDIGASEG